MTKAIENKNIKDFTSASGTKYKFQRVSPAAWLDIMDAVENKKEAKNRTLYTAVMESVVVQPKMTIEDFEEYGEMEEVVTAAIRFQRGK